MQQPAPETLPNPRIRSLGFGAATTLAALAIGGCQPISEGAGEPSANWTAFTSMDATVDSSLSTSNAVPGDGGTSPKPAVEILSAASYPPKCRSHVTVADDGKTVLLEFDDLQLSIERGRSLQYCAVDASVHVPPGYAFALEGISGAATVALPEGVSVRFETSYTFARVLDSAGQITSSELRGPLDGNVTLQHDFPSPGFYCGDESLRLDAHIILKNDTGRPATVALRSLEVGRFVITPCSELDSNGREKQ